jgi:hypothetical protein
MLMKRIKVENTCKRLRLNLILLDEGIYVLAMYLDLFLQHCFHKWPTIFAIASKIMSDISINDLEFYSHLKKIAKINVKIDVKVDGRFDQSLFGVLFVGLCRGNNDSRGYANQF